MDVRNEMLALMRRKDEIEREIGSLYDILKSENNIGMKEPVVDSEGYPRSDVDVYLVRHTRHRIICLQNDHKALMKEIEAGLHLFHAQQREKNESNPDQGNGDTVMLSPFARVDRVESCSPAFNADLRVEDKIARFGSVVSSNFTDMSHIGSIVQHSIGKPIHVEVIRDDRMLNKTLVPSAWSGKGLLGCSIVPLKK